ncbi:unnamed protein product [Haemonchus placei]|uniref:Cytochrome P450 n=1 Tax=Haemonchus placei TaxID=6290 RepID=A0A0N4WLA1_HAEPC|nr:unnamed protein product [Haemonchus placei]
MYPGILTLALIELNHLKCNGLEDDLCQEHARASNLRECTNTRGIWNFTEDDVLPEGTGVVVVPSMVHRDPKYWNDPQVFRPERFIDGELKHPYAYIPFPAGSRNCIGQRFAMMEEKCILALLMRHLRVLSLLRTNEMRVAAELIIHPLHGNRIKFEESLW